MTTRSTDVVVVGFGPAAIALVERLAGTGARTVIIERGPDDAQQYGKPAGTVLGWPYDLEATRKAGAGGTARSWYGRTLDGVGHGRFCDLSAEVMDGRPWADLPAWPIDSEEMKGWFRETRELLGLPLDTPQGGGHDVLLSASDGKITAFDFQFIRRERIIHELTRRVGEHPDVEVLFECEFLSFLGGGTPFVSRGIEAVQNGQRIRIEADYVVLAAGGVENVTLLLEPSPGAEHALGNSSGQLGRGFMEHPFFQPGVLIASPDVSLAAGEGRPDWYRHRNWAIERYYELSSSVRQEHGLLSSAFGLYPRPWNYRRVLDVYGDRTSSGTEAARSAVTALKNRAWSDLQAGFNGVRSDPRPALRNVSLLARHFAGGLRQSRPVFALKSYSEQRRHAASRVVLGAPGRSGRRTPVVKYHFSARDLADTYRYFEVLGEILESTGVGRFIPTFGPDRLPFPFGMGHHHMGATVMDHDAVNGVVDPDLRVHDSENVFVLGSSVFPSGGHEKPTLALMALGRRLAAHIEALGGAGSPTANLATEDFGYS